MKVPTRLELINPLIEALHQLGGSGSVPEIEDTVASILALSEDQLNVIHRGTRTKFSYELSWARQYLRKYGLLELSKNKIWSLTGVGRRTKKVNPNEVNKVVNALSHNRAIEPIKEQIEEEEQEITWQTKLLKHIVSLTPSAFEHICKRVLRESGFVEVKVTGKPGDRGIDGEGVIKVGEILTFRAKFQAKKYKADNPVRPDEVREFRGSLSPSEKGVLITTSRFTEEARKEAVRDGMIPIDLIDGEELSLFMKKYELGLKVEEVKEIVIINYNWFKNF